MVNKLVIPAQLPGNDIECNQAVGIKIRPVTGPAEIVPGRRLHRQIDQPQFRVRRHRRPDARVAGVIGRSVIPGLVAGLARFRNRVEGPQQFAAARVEATNIAFHITH